MVMLCAVCRLRRATLECPFTCESIASWQMTTSLNFKAARASIWASIVVSLNRVMWRLAGVSHWPCDIDGHRKPIERLLQDHHKLADRIWPRWANSGYAVSFK